MCFWKCQKSDFHCSCLSSSLAGGSFSATGGCQQFGCWSCTLENWSRGIDHAVSFFSRKIYSYQLNYSIVEKEALALIWALKHVYVGGRGKTLCSLYWPQPIDIHALSAKFKSAINTVVIISSAIQPRHSTYKRFCECRGWCSVTCTAYLKVGLAC